MEAIDKTENGTADSRGLSPAEFMIFVWAGKWIIFGVAAFFAIFSIIFVLMMPNIYRAQATLIPNDDGGKSGFAALASQYGGLASLAGVSLDAGSSNNVVIGLEILRSRKFISEYINRHNILVPLLAAKSWHANTDELYLDPDVYDTQRKEWVRKVSPPKRIVPTEQEAYERFLEILSVSQDSKTGVISIAIEHVSPSIAKQWVEWIVEDSNQEVMSKDVAEAEHAIAFLKEQVQSTSLAELQSVFFSLIEEQIKTVMLAKVSKEYLLKTLDPAVAPEEKVKPMRSIVVISCTLLGGIIGFGFVVLRSIAGKWRRVARG